jgi:hypothetical protein
MLMVRPWVSDDDLILHFLSNKRFYKPFPQTDNSQENAHTGLIKSTFVDVQTIIRHRRYILLKIC